MLARRLTADPRHVVTDLCDARAHLSASDDREVFDSDIPDGRRRQTSADVMSEERHDVSTGVKPAAGRSEGRAREGRSAVT